MPYDLDQTIYYLVKNSGEDREKNPYVVKSEKYRDYLNRFGPNIDDAPIALPSHGKAALSLEELVQEILEEWPPRSQE